MKKIFSLASMLFIFTGCSLNSQPDFSGTVVKVKEEVLVIENLPESEIKNYKDYLSENESAYWLSGTNKKLNDLKPGMKIDVWINGETGSSYPASVEVKKILIK